MKHLIAVTLLVVLVGGCTTKEEHITQVVGPKDWQPPALEWHSIPDAEVRGTVGLDVAITDSSAIPLVKLYVDGALRDSLMAMPYRFSLCTDSLLDGVHLCEARAWDQYGNLGISPILRVNVMNSVTQGPRLLWVPDSFANIQAAINAATDYDTIRVRDGTYYEMLFSFGKGIWIESEHGPTATIINGLYQGETTVFVTASRALLTIRGFTILYGGSFTVDIEDAAQFLLVNNIITANVEDACVWVGRAEGSIRNNLLVGRHLCLEIWSQIGNVNNNIMEGATSTAMWNASYHNNPVQYGWNLFWQDTTDYYHFAPGTGDVHGDPLIDMSNRALMPGSPAIDSGVPYLRDVDSTRSDIGPFGGPLGYR